MQYRCSSWFVLLTLVRVFLLILAPATGTANTLDVANNTALQAASVTVNSRLTSQTPESASAKPASPVSRRNPPADATSVTDIFLLFGLSLFVLVGVSSWAERPGKRQLPRRGKNQSP